MAGDGLAELTPAVEPCCAWVDAFELLWEFAGEGDAVATVLFEFDPVDEFRLPAFDAEDVLALPPLFDPFDEFALPVLLEELSLPAFVDAVDEFVLAGFDLLFELAAALSRADEFLLLA